MRAVRVIGVSLISASLASVAIGVFMPLPAWFQYFAFISAVAGFILATGDLGRFSARGRNGVQRLLRHTRRRPDGGERGN